MRLPFIDSDLLYIEMPIKAGLTVFVPVRYVADIKTSSHTNIYRTEKKQFVNHFLSFCIFSFGHCVVCTSSIYGFLVPVWYLQTLLTVL